MSKRKIHFTISTRGDEPFRTGEVSRFQWADLYRALQLLKEYTANPVLKELIDHLLGTTRDLIEQELWKILALIEADPNVRDNSVLCIGWIIACYGYTHGLSTGGESSWPLPRKLRRTRRPRIKDWRLDLICPLCQRPYRIPKNVKAKDKVLQRFGKWLVKHILDDPH
jgi:hypothetical protein